MSAHLLRPIAVFAILASSMSCFGEVPAKKDDPANVQFEMGKHYRIVLREIDGDEAVTTTYWTTVTQADERSIRVTDGEWTQSTGPLIKPRSQIVMNRIFTSIDRMLGHKTNVAIGRGMPMGDEIAVLPRSEITQASLISEGDFLERKERHMVSRPRPPHAVISDAGD